MPYYKGIYYADGATLMDAAQISLDEATSIDTTIQAVRNGGMVVTVANAAERDAIFPTPASGNAVWLGDAAVEQRYISGYGWVAYSDGMMPIPIPSAVPGGTGSSFKNLGVGGLSFDKCTSLTINNIFTNEFDNYKVFLNINSTTSGDTFSIRYTLNGANNSSANYVRAGVAATGASPVTFFNNSAAGNFLVADTGARNSSAEIDFMRPNRGYFPLALTSITTNNNSTAQTVARGATQFNSATAPAFDGIYIFSSSSGTAAATGTVKIYGYN